MNVLKSFARWILMCLGFMYILSQMQGCIIEQQRGEEEGARKVHKAMGLPPPSKK